ncbi:GAF domain-containing protein [Paenibacillus vini]|uniref:GAF domain-containing protein n=1 Tax=Paenibacillus vini TaxID=1476024 RepID=UPI0025B68B25|nr:GAF domain-containing protein [Paenibacillus vini]MDN4071093.1 GAF domain-containing protein [Paenibacillus vini]
MSQSSNQYQMKIDQLREQLGYDFVSLAFAQSASDGFVITWQFASGNLNNRYKRILLQSGKGIAGIVFKTGKPMLVSNVKEELSPQDLFNDYPIIISERLNSLAAIPLYQLDRVEGVLLAGFREGKTVTKNNFRQLYDSLKGQFGDFRIKESTFR